ncbi:MAG: RluA family pseudouridine synthase [Flavobacteriia bacterium]|nr:RluA family pseudouridine synthase [Flavobacteriia bacterium]
MNLESIEKRILFEDNHLLILNKNPSELVQGDKTGDVTLPDLIKNYLKVKHNKPGNVFCGVTHRLDRPTSGIVVFAKTSKALERMNKIFQEKQSKKTYWAIIENKPSKENDTLTDYLLKKEKLNKSFAYKNEVKGSKKAILHYQTVQQSQNYFLLEIDLETGRHHQIRCQLANIQCYIKGDVKYGAKRSNENGSIDLHARKISFLHPVSKEKIEIIAPVPPTTLWKHFENSLLNK